MTAVTMGKFRTILACLIALAVAAAPVAVTPLASAGGRAATVAAAAKHDCHGMTQDHEKGQHGKAGCPDCQDQDRDYAKCTGDGSKCCKLTGMVTVLPAVAARVAAVNLVANPPTLIGWQVRPSPPPPRA
jgi:hypothetical protein